MPFGLHSAPATFQRLLDKVIGPEMDNCAFAYLDDIVVFGHSLEEHTENLKRVFRRLQEANLKINPEKCEFLKRELPYLGHVITQNGIHTNPEKIAAIKELQPPTNLKELRSCLGLASWYRRFVPNFAEITQPLTSLLKKGRHFKWGQPQAEAFETIKAKLTEAPILACPDFEQPFTLQTDASNFGLGAVLTQIQDGSERVISYASRKLDKAEMNYSPTEKECLAIVWGIRKMRPYLEGYHFKVITDHLALKWLNTIENPTGRIARWALELQQYSFEVTYRKGKLNVIADTLSRQPRNTLARLRVETPSNEVDCQWVTKMKEAVVKDPAKHRHYVMLEGRLYRSMADKKADSNMQHLKLCVPESAREKVLEECHCAVSAGHLGRFKTLKRVTEKYYWPGLQRDVHHFVSSCDSCQRYKVSQRLPAGEMLTKIAQEPWEIICADFVGPLPKSIHGNTMLLVFHDKFSKWVELVPLRRATSETLTKAFRSHILAKGGTPKILITDNGPQFSCNRFQKYLQTIGVHQQFTAPYTPQENPTERANRTIKTIIAQITEGNQRNWDECLPEIALAINSSVSETTGYSPAYVLYGKQLRLPGMLYDRNLLGVGREMHSTTDKTEKMQKIIEKVRSNLEKAAKQQAKYYNLRRRKWKPEVGQLVLAKQHPLSNAANHFNAKLAPKYDGPYKVWNFISPVIILLKHPNSGKIIKTHISDIKEYCDRDTAQTNTTTT